MEKLKVGDKLFYKNSGRWYNSITYSFADVVRLTKTLAVLSNGIKLIIEPTKDTYSNNDICYIQYGDRYKKWFITTEEVLNLAKKEREKTYINNWFLTRGFSDEEKRIVYLKFKELNLLNSVSLK